jgi:hypothetical protein
MPATPPHTNENEARLNATASRREVSVSTIERDFIGTDLEELVASVHAKCALYVAGRRAYGASDYEILAEISAGKLRAVLSEDEREAIVYWETLKKIIRRDILRGRAPNKRVGNSDQ